MRARTCFLPFSSCFFPHITPLMLLYPVAGLVAVAVGPSSQTFSVIPELTSSRSLRDPSPSPQHHLLRKLGPPTAAGSRYTSPWLLHLLSLCDLGVLFWLFSVLLYLFSQFLCGSFCLNGWYGFFFPDWIWVVMMHRLCSWGIQLTQDMSRLWNAATVNLNFR